MIRFKDGVNYRITDLPGIMSGAADDKVQGRRVLRHTYRSKLLLFVVDIARKPQSKHGVPQFSSTTKGLGGNEVSPDADEETGPGAESNCERRGRKSSRGARNVSKEQQTDESEEEKAEEEDAAFSGDHHYKDAWEQFLRLRKEAIDFDPLNAEKPFIIVGTKGDMLHKDSLFNLDSLFFRWQGKGFTRSNSDVVGVSARFGLGMSTLVRVIRSLLQNDSLEMRVRHNLNMGEYIRRDHRPLLVENYYGDNAPQNLLTEG